MADAKKKTTSDEAAAATVPVEQGSDWAGSWEYRDMPDDRKPSPSTVAQEQILPGDDTSG